MIRPCIFILVGLAVNTLTRPQQWAVALCFMLLTFSDLAITCFLSINQSFLFSSKYFWVNVGNSEHLTLWGQLEISTSVCTKSLLSVQASMQGWDFHGALGSLRGEKGHSNTGDGFVERNAPWKVFFGRMSNNKVGEEVWEQEWLFWKQGKSLLLQRSGVFRSPWYCKN